MTKLSFPLSVRCVVIDLDGTLLDTVEDLAIAINLLFDQLGRPPLDVSLVRTFVGKGIAHLVRRALASSYRAEPDAALLERALPLYFQCYESVNGRHTTIYPGVMEGLSALHDAGFGLACITNKSERFALPLLEKMGMARYFSLVVGGDTLARKKPDPLPLTHSCRHFGIVPAQMLMIGDSINDAAAARAAGCPVFCVPYGYNEGANVRTLDVDAIVETLFEATKLIVKS
jgi:phosphoglycolate phosphatase